MLVVPPTPLRRTRTLAWLIVALGLGSTPAPAQDLEPPQNPLCRPCEAAFTTYWEAWPKLDTKLADLDKKEKDLKESREAASEGRRKAIDNRDKTRQEHYTREQKRVEAELEKLYAERTDAYHAVEAQQIAIEQCIKRKCYMGSEGPAPASPAGDAEKCKQCKPLADRVALLDYRLGELNQIDKMLVADQWWTESRKWFTKKQRDAGQEMSIALEVARKRAQKELEACHERTKERCGPEKAEPPAGTVDRCLVGQWKSEPVSVGGGKPKGGDGIVMTIKADGTLMIDYNKMTPIPASSVGVGSNLLQGTATGRIETREGKARVQSVENSVVTLKFTDAQGKVHNRPVSGLGSYALGNNVMGGFVYRCSDTTLTYENPPHKFTFKRVP